MRRLGSRGVKRLLVMALLYMYLDFVARAL